MREMTKFELIDVAVHETYTTLQNDVDEREFDEGTLVRRDVQVECLR